MERILDEFKYKNELQQSFINRFKLKREWIFSGLIKTQKFNDDQIKLLRKANINVNRINAFNYEFPICMSISTFLFKHQKYFHSIIVQIVNIHGFYFKNMLEK